MIIYCMLRSMFLPSHFLLKIPHTNNNFHIYFQILPSHSNTAQKTSSKIEIIKKIYGDMQPVNLFFYTYIGYNKVIKGNVYGRYLSREINTKTDK